MKGADDKGNKGKVVIWRIQGTGLVRVKGP